MYCIPLWKLELNCQSGSSLCCRRVSLWANHGEGWSLASGTSKLKHFAEVCHVTFSPSPDILILSSEIIHFPARTACFLPDISSETWDELYTSKLQILHFGRCTLAVPSITLHFGAGKSTLPFTCQLHSIRWTLDVPQIEMLSCQENQAVWMF